MCGTFPVTQARSPHIRHEYNRKIILHSSSWLILLRAVKHGTSMAHAHHNCTILRGDNFGHKAIMPQAEDPRHNLRLPPELKKKLAHSAVDNGRSMNAEILSRLEKSFAPSPMQEVESLLRNMLSLGDDDRTKVAELLSQATSILSKR